MSEEEAVKKRWYVVQAYSQYESRVKKTLLEYIKMHNMEDYFGQVLVPTEEVVEMRAGQKRKSERKFYPGYVLVEMAMTEESWHLVKSVPRVLGFIGGTSDRPMPITQKEADAILNRLEENVDKPRPKTLFEPGSYSRYRWPICRLQRCGRRSRLRKEPRKSIGTYLRAFYSSRPRIRSGRKRLSLFNLPYSIFKKPRQTGFFVLVTMGSTLFTQH